MEEVLLKQESRNTGNGGREQKARTKIKEESGVCRELSVSAQRRKAGEVVRERAGRRGSEGSLENTVAHQENTSAHIT